MLLFEHGYPELLLKALNPFGKDFDFLAVGMGFSEAELGLGKLWL